MREDELRDRIANLRAALERIRDREPRREAFEGLAQATYVGHTDEVRRCAEQALAQDDARAEVEAE